MVNGVSVWVRGHKKSVEPDLPLAPRVEALELPNQFRRATPTAPLVYMVHCLRRGPRALPPLAVGRGYTHIQWAFLMLLVPTDCYLKFSRFQHVALSDKNAFLYVHEQGFRLCSRCGLCPQGQI